MSWRIVQITKPSKISIKNKQFVIEVLGETSATIPMEDISVIILENNQILFNSYFVSQLSEYNIVMISCDGSHTPSGVFFPFHNHSRYSEMAWSQMEVSEPFKKRLWQDIIKSKISNQALVLEHLNKDNINALKEISKKVLSGDIKNSEAFAANIYWKSLFDDFNRSDDSNIINSALNYGYAIIRGCVARYIVASGLIPCFGIHHANKLNQFNLVDDIMEPYRPFMDYLVYRLDLQQKNEIDKETKTKIISILTTNCFIDDEEINFLKAVEMTTTSLAKSMKNKEAKYLELPVFNKLVLFE